MIEQIKSYRDNTTYTNFKSLRGLYIIDINKFSAVIASGANTFLS